MFRLISIVCILVTVWFTALLSCFCFLTFSFPFSHTESWRKEKRSKGQNDTDTGLKPFGAIGFLPAASESSKKMCCPTDIQLTNIKRSIKLGRPSNFTRTRQLIDGNLSRGHRPSQSSGGVRWTLTFLFQSTRLLLPFQQNSYHYSQQLTPPQLESALWN